MANLSNINNKFLVTDGGKVGIGITAPTGILHTDQTFSGYAPVTFKNSVTNQGQFVELITSTDEGSKYTGIESISLQTGNGWKVWGGGNNFGEMYLSVSGSHAIVIKSDLKVGIGTNLPSSKLHIAQSTASNLILKLEQGNASYESWFEANSADGGFFRTGIGTDANNYAFFNTDQASYRWYGAGGGSPGMILTNGLLGIGTSSPDTKLHISSAALSDIRLENTGTAISGGDNYGQIEWEGNDINTSANGIRASIQVKGYGAGTQGETGMYFRTSYIGADSNVDRMVISHLGNVGIGTTSPTRRFQVSGSIATNVTENVCRIEGGTWVNSGGITIESTGANGASGRLTTIYSIDNQDQASPLAFGTGTTARYKITENGSHQWTTDGSFSTSFTYSFRDAVGINNPNSVSAQAVAGYVLSVGRSNDSSTSVSGGIISQGESHFVRGVSFGPSGQGQMLNYYKEGTWTPTLNFGGNVVGIAYGGAAGTVYRGGHYTRVGRVVTFSFRIILTSKGTSVGAATITGLPFLVANLQGNYGSAMYSFANNFLIPERPTITIDNNSSVIRLRFVNSPNGSYGNVTNSGFNDNSDIILTGTYQAAPA